MTEKDQIKRKKIPDVLPETLRSLINSLQTATDLKPAQVVKMMKKAAVSAEDLKEWADYDHPVTDSYGRKLIFKDANFEIMAMSWRPGDFSTIHDHGHTQWGAVQIFGPAEHATFREEDGFISTLARWLVEPGDIVGVGHSLIHQMGNPTSDVFFMSLHVYGDVHAQSSITGDARIFDLETESIFRVNGGVFYALPQEEIDRVEEGPKADFPTRLRHMVELIRRLRRMKEAGAGTNGRDLNKIIEDAFSSDHRKQLLTCLSANTNQNDHQSNSIYWRALNRELKETAILQNELYKEQRADDRFHKYAALYDSLICQPCMDAFIRKYLFFFSEKYMPDLTNKKLISIGSGTGLIEAFMIREMGVDYNNLYGIDISEAMVRESQKRIRADVGDVLSLDPGVQMWDVAYSGLNVYQYLQHNRLEEAIQKTASIVKPGGYFVGDFITPDHIRWYPNVVYSDDKKIISLRTPALIEQSGRMFQESEIINISFADGPMRVTYAGKHKRFLPPLHRIRTYFEKAFGGQVDLYDAHSLEIIPEDADSCVSTRYIVVAHKA
ncbi:MAG: methyltransferase domain-containing protein [Bacteroidetes bacterium]|nr:methyltransferase domain-containing protein [Bacteroidota bacterium]